jgi:hypothetical protein
MSSGWVSDQGREFFDRTEAAKIQKYKAALELLWWGGVRRTSLARTGSRSSTSSSLRPGRHQENSRLLFDSAAPGRHNRATVDVTPPKNPGWRGRPLLEGRAAARGITFLLSLLGAIVVTWPLARDGAAATLRSGEVLLTAWQLNWYHEALLTNPLAWADANIFFPYGRTATFNDLLITHALVTLPVAWAESPVLALNLALLGGIGLCGLCAHLLIEELVGDVRAAICGGTLFALTPFRFIHLGHLSIAAAWPIPLFFWALLRHMREPTWKRAAATAASGVLVGLSSLYHAAYVAPILPLVVWFAARRGTGGSGAWLRLAAAALPALALLAWFFLPFAATLRGFGVAAAPDDLLRYGADLSSLARKPEYLASAPDVPGIDPEAHLYPGSALVWLAVAGGLWALLCGARPGWRRGMTMVVAALTAVHLLGFLLRPSGRLHALWNAGVLVIIWVGPVAAAVWAASGARAGSPVSITSAARFGTAGAALSFVLALGPQARYLADAIGPAPYSLLARASSVFEGTRVPARFGGVAILFLSVVAAAAIAAVTRSASRTRQFAGTTAATLAIVLCFAELPLPALPRGHELVALPNVRDAAYRWIRDQPGRFGILELPDWSPDSTVHWRYREWRSLRHMLASKQHGLPLVNGTGRIEPFLWQRFRWLEPWQDEFFTYISAYFPVRYVVVHENGLPVETRDALWARLDSGRDGWRAVFRSTRIRVFALDRSSGRGPTVDRLYLRRDLVPAASIAFTARVLAGQSESDGAQATLELLRDGEAIASWPVGASWQPLGATVTIPPVPPNASEWPETGTLLRWRVRGSGGAVVELRDITAVRSSAPVN